MSGLLKSTLVVSLMTMISRVLGFARDIVFANYFGATQATDAFFVAFKIPNFLRRLFAEGAFSQAFVPVLSEYRSQQDKDDVQQLINRVAGTLGLILTAITVIGVLAAPLLIWVFAPGFADDAGKMELATVMLRFTFPYLLFISLTAFAGGILNSYGKFAVPSFTPVFLNIVMIAAAIWLSPQMDEPVVALAVGVFVAGIVQLGFQLPALWRLGLIPRARWGWAHKGVRKILRLMIPAIFGSSVAQINLLLDTLIASFLVSGSISWLYYSDRLMEFPLGVFGVALSTVILPTLSRRHAEGNSKDFSATLDWALRWVVVIAVPAMLGLALLAGPMLSTLFQHGQFDALAVQQSAKSLLAYSLGIPAFIMIKVLAPGYYARQDTRTPVRIGIIALVANMVLNIALVFPLAHVGLALATSLSAYLNAALLYRGLRKSGVYQPLPDWLPLAMRMSLASVVMSAVLLWLVPALPLWLVADTLSKVWWLVLAVLSGLAGYFLTLWVTRFDWQQLRKPG